MPYYAKDRQHMEKKINRMATENTESSGGTPQEHMAEKDGAREHQVEKEEKAREGFRPVVNW